MDDMLDTTEPGTGTDRWRLALGEACRKVGADLSEDAAFDGLQAAVLAFTGVFKGYLGNGSIDQKTYDLVLATSAALLRAGEAQHRC
jgi:hypothetical protein